MSVHFRRRPPSPSEEMGAAAFSFLVGAGAAAVTWYVTRLLLSRERLDPDGADAALEEGPRRARLNAGTSASATDD